MLRALAAVAVALLAADCSGGCSGSSAESTHEGESRGLDPLDDDTEPRYPHKTFHPGLVELIAQSCAHQAAIDGLRDARPFEESCAACASKHSTDDWGTVIRIECFDSGIGRVTSAGADRSFGTEDDSFAEMRALSGDR